MVPSFCCELSKNFIQWGGPGYVLKFSCSRINIDALPTKRDQGLVCSWSCMCSCPGFVPLLRLWSLIFSGCSPCARIFWTGPRNIRRICSWSAWSYQLSSVELMMLLERAPKYSEGDPGFSPRCLQIANVQPRRFSFRSSDRFLRLCLGVAYVPPLGPSYITLPVCYVPGVISLHSAIIEVDSPWFQQPVEIVCWLSLFSARVF